MVEVDNTYGILFIGVLLSAVLFGVTNLQVFLYFQKYPDDHVWNKSAVGVLWALDALHLAFCTHMIYSYLVTDYGDTLALLKMTWSFKAQIIIDTIVVILVHTLYTLRLLKMTAVEEERPRLRRFLLTTVSTIVSLGYGAGILLCYEITTLSLFSELLDSKWITYLPLGWATGVDIIISAALCYLLSRCRTGFEEMDSTITVLMLYTLNTGMITALCSATAMICFALLPKTFTVLCIELLVTKLYVNSFMAMLNARASLRTQASLSFAPAPSAPTSPVAPYRSNSMFTRSHTGRHISASTDDSAFTRCSLGVVPGKVSTDLEDAGAVCLRPLRRVGPLRLDTSAAGLRRESAGTVRSIAPSSTEKRDCWFALDEDRHAELYREYASMRPHPYRLSLGDPIIASEAASVSDAEIGTIVLSDSREGLCVGVALTKD